MHTTNIFHFNSIYELITDVKSKHKAARSPLLAFCDAMMSSVKAAGSKPNEALSMDCMEAGLKENRLDLAYHWLAQER